MVRLSVNTILLSILSVASASSPLLAWTNNKVAVKSINYATADGISDVLSPFLEKCPKSILILNQPDLDLTSLNKMKNVKKNFSKAKSALQIAHYEASDVNSIDSIVNAIAAKCDNALVSEDEIKKENVMVVSTLSRKNKDSEKKVKKLLNKLDDDSLVLCLSDNKVQSGKLLIQRQNTTTDPAATTTTGTETATPTATNNGTANATQTGEAQQTPVKEITEETATFGKYVFLNTAVFESLVVLVPFMLILIIGVSWLIAIQTPTRFEKKKEN